MQFNSRKTLQLNAFSVAAVWTRCERQYKIHIKEYDAAEFLMRGIKDEAAQTGTACDLFLLSY